MRNAFIIAFAFFILSCKKDEKYPIKFYGDRVEVRTATRLFDHTGEIKNTTEIAAFVKDAEYFKAENDQSGKGKFAFQLLSADSASFDQYTFNFSTHQNGDQFLFYSSFGAFPPNRNQADFKLNLFKHTYSALSSTSGPLGPFSFETAREVRVAYGNLKQLKFRMIAYLAISSYGGTSISSTGGLANNDFNEGALSMMRDGDMLAIKIYDVMFKAK